MDGDHETRSEGNSSQIMDNESLMGTFLSWPRGGEGGADEAEI